jgi:hypothetical protein
MAKPKFNPAANGGITRTWASTHGSYIAGRAYVDEADATALELERKWGIGRLRLLVGPELREKFDRQRLLFNQAIWHGQDIEAVKRESLRMVKAWLALDQAATEAGKEQANPAFVECALADGSVAVIVPDNAPAEAVHGDGREMAVFTASEVARLLDGYPALSKAKWAFPGATVTAVRPISDPLDAFADSRDGLDAPFSETDGEASP